MTNPAPATIVVGPHSLAVEMARGFDSRGVPAQAVTWDTVRSSDPAQWDSVGRNWVVVAQPEPGLADHAALHDVLQGTFRAATAATRDSGAKIVVVSSLQSFRRHPANWRVDPRWAPRPSTEVTELLPVLVENSVREAIRETGVRGVVLRLPSPAEAGADASLSAISDALAAGEGGFWQIRHMGERPVAPADQRPWKEILACPDPIPTRPIRKVVVFGAGGPMGAALFPLLRDRFEVRLTDLRTMAEVKATGYGHQPPGSPLPETPEAPHEEMLCDVTDPEQVLRACEGMDAIVNCSVIRYTDRDHAVNTIGCWNIAKAAAAHRIRRIVQTGPQLTHLDPLVGYHADYDSPGNAPPRPGRNLYGHTKFLGNDILRAFAHWHDLEVPVLVFNGFVTAQSRGENVFETTFEESADAIVKALDAPGFPSPWEMITVNNDLPYGRNSAQRAWELLGWKTSQFLEDTWRD